MIREAEWSIILDAHDEYLRQRPQRFWMEPGGVPEMGVPPSGWFIMEHPNKKRMIDDGNYWSLEKMDDLGWKVLLGGEPPTKAK